MNFDFEKVLFYATLITGIIALFDIIFLARRRKQAASVEANTAPKMPIIVDYARAFFPVLLLVFLFRSFLFEAYRIPSGSLEPTLLVGDFILVNKYKYGLRLPVFHNKIYSNENPQRGDIMVFHWPPNPSIYFIKRVIGLPGDKVSYINKVLYINGKQVPQEFEKNTTMTAENDETFNVALKLENLLGVQHSIYVIPDTTSMDFKDIEVPQGMYFMMGDNRDASADSRVWGFVPDKNIVGKASLILLSWNSAKYNIRWDRIGNPIH